MSELLIPFGIHRDTGAIVEPEDAPKGRACDCLCPGCKAPLLSRHPKENRYHFAHDSRHEDAKPEEECPFSSAVAVAMMVRKIAEIANGKILKTPPLLRMNTFYCCGQSGFIEVTRGASNVIDNVQANVKVFGHHVDVVLEIRGYRILVDLVYEGKPSVFIEEEKLQANSAALLELDCDSFSMSTLKINRSLRFSESALDFLLSDGLRSWRFHPKTASALHKANEIHRCSSMGHRRGVVARYGYQSVNQAITIPEIFEAHLPDMAKREPTCYQCVVCGVQWMHDFSRSLLCPNGHGHLYAKEVE
jgi:hypothetical protein